MNIVTRHCRRLLFTLSTLRHPHTSPYESDAKATLAVLLCLEAAALQDVDVSMCEVPVSGARGSVVRATTTTLPLTCMPNLFQPAVSHVCSCPPAK